MKERKRKLDLSRSWHLRQNKVIAQGALTNSKRPSHYPPGYPTHIASAKGCIVTDVDGNEYIDYVMALGGAGVLGYADDNITRVVNEQLKKGSLFSVASTLEVQLAERLCELFPWLTKWRFFKTGSEACTTAVRIARANHYPHDMLVYSHGYHGWHDEFCSLTEPARGVIIPYRPNIFSDDSNKEAWDSAIWIIEPYTIVDGKLVKPSMLTAMALKANNRLLIFDEIVTGFRFPEWAACKRHSIKPDILVLGKAAASGLPLGIVGMTKEVHDDSGEWFCSSTFAGDTLALAACLETIRILTNEKPLDWLWAQGEEFLKRFKEVAPKVKIEGYPTRCMIQMTDPYTALFCQQMVKAGVFFGKAWFYTFAHPEYNDQVLSIAKDVAERIERGGVEYEGDLPRESFRR